MLLEKDIKWQYGMIDHIGKYFNSLPDELCDDIINKMEEMIVSKKNGIYFNNDDSRNDINIFPLHYQSCDKLNDDLKTHLKKCYNEYFSNFMVSVDFEDAFDSIKWQKSSKGGGFYTWHYEQGRSETSRNRFGVWMIYLNSTSTGYTEFKYQDRRVHPIKGTTLIWPAGYTHLHRAAPDLEEDKYIATGWFSYND